MSKSSQRRRAIAARRFKQILAASFMAASFFGNSVVFGDSPAQPIVNRYVTQRPAAAPSTAPKAAALPPVVTTKALPGAEKRKAPKPIAVQAAFDSAIADEPSQVMQVSGVMDDGEPTPARPRPTPASAPRSIAKAGEALPPILTAAEMRALKTGASVMRKEAIQPAMAPVVNAKPQVDAALAPVMTGAQMRAKKAADLARQTQQQTTEKLATQTKTLAAQAKQATQQAKQDVEEAAAEVAADLSNASSSESPSPWMQSLATASREVVKAPAKSRSEQAAAAMPLESLAKEAAAEVAKLPSIKPQTSVAPAFTPVSKVAEPKTSAYGNQQVVMQFEDEEEPAKPAEVAPEPMELVAPAEEPPQRLAPVVEEVAQPDSGIEEGELFREIKEAGDMEVMVHRSKIIRTKTDLYRTAVVDDGICEIVQFTPRELSIIGKSQGSTHVTFWFDDPKSDPVTYLVRVTPDVAEVKKVEDAYKLLEDVINEMYPDSKITLSVVADKVIVKGQAKDSEEAFQIITLIRGQGGSGNVGGAGGFGNGFGGGGLNEGIAAPVLSDSAVGNNRRANLQIINMLRVPGIQQVALRVKIAELNRTAARNFGASIQGEIPTNGNTNGAAIFLNAITGTGGQAAPTLLTRFDGDNVQVGLNTLQQQGVVKLLGEPTLVTMSGRPATFIAGGEFAVPTIVGSAGLNAVTTDFRAYGAIISFLPTVVDKDRIRLEVSPEFSQINQNLTVNNIPGLRTRSATTTVEMREGQSLAIAGLLEDNMTGNNSGDVPFLAQIFGKRSMQRNETELLILVSPELVHPMDAEEVPPLPGFDVQEPNNKQFFFKGELEGNPTQDYRSTVWPRLKKRYGSGGPAMTSGPFGHGK